MYIAPEAEQKLSLADDVQVKEKTGRPAHGEPARFRPVWAIARSAH
jgi:hypothetical protein